MKAPFNVFKIEELESSGQVGICVVRVKIKTWLEFTHTNEERIKEFIRDAINKSLNSAVRET